MGENGVLVTGVTGRVVWHYYVAAAINGYRAARLEKRWSLRATVVLSDAFKMAQRPLVFEASHKNGTWRWPVLSHELRDGVLTAQLGSPEGVPCVPGSSVPKPPGSSCPVVIG